MNILITGGNGFIGSKLRKALEAKSHSVYILARRPAGYKSQILGDVRDKELDISMFDLVYHLAAVANPRICEEQRDIAWSINVEGTLNIVKKIGRGAKLVFMSSAHVYEKKMGAHKESEPLKPQSFYGLTKLLGEEIVKYFGTKNGFETTIFRLFNTYAADQPAGFIVPDVIHKYMNKDEVEVVNPESSIDVIHVDDVVAVLSSVVENSMPGVYNLCSGKPKKISEIYAKIKEYCKADGRRERQVKNEEPVEFYGDNSKLTKLGFKFREFTLP